MSPTVISVEKLCKTYRLGTIGGGTLRADVSRWLAKLRGKTDPNLKIGQEHQARLLGQEFKALQNVSFEVKQGEILGIIGRNGAGKSTLLKILSRVTAPSSGLVKVKGRIASLLEVGTGFHPELTGRENIFLNGAILGMSKAEIRKKFDEIVAFSGVEDFIDTPVKRYSSGMYVRLAFAVAAHLEPEILIVDEVLAVGDAEFQKKCLGKMQDVSTREGRTVLFVSHNMAAIQRLCLRCVMLSKGSLAASGSTSSIIGDYLRSDASAKFSLEDFPDRSGTGAVRLIGFHIEDLEGHKLDHVQSGLDFDLVFQFKCAKPSGSGKVDIGFSLHQVDETILSVMYSSYTGQRFETISRSGEFRCRINRLPLKEGRYLVGVRIEAEGQEADWPQGMIGEIDVVAGDFYRSGIKGFDGSAPLLLTGSWSIK